MATATLSLNGITLNPNAKWPDKRTSQGVQQSVQEALGDSIVVFSVPRTAGRRFTILADRESGWIQKAAVEQLEAIADEPGGIYVLNVNGIEYSVMFDHENEPAFSARALIDQLNEDADGDGSWFTYTMKLMLVS